MRIASSIVLVAASFILFSASAAFAEPKDSAATETDREKYVAKNRNKQSNVTSHTHSFAKDKPYRRIVDAEIFKKIKASKNGIRT